MKTAFIVGLVVGIGVALAVALPVALRSHRHMPVVTAHYDDGWVSASCWGVGIVPLSSVPFEVKER